MDRRTPPVVRQPATACRIRRVLSQLVALLLLFVVVSGSSARLAYAHPLHTTLAALSYDATKRTITVSLRVFADDFSAAVTGAATHTGEVLPSDSLMSRYVMQRFTVVNASKRPVVFQWCGVKRAAEVLLLCLRASDARGLTGARVLSTLLRERFDDQVNMVQATYGGRRHMLLFTKRDDARVLP